MLRLVTLCLCLMLPACGFQPVYGDHAGKPDGAATSFKDVSIGLIPDREGQILRNELIDRLHYGSNISESPGAARYHLLISRIGESRRNFNIAKTADATRTQLRLTIVMRLIDKQDNKGVLNRSLVAFASYNILDSQFATRVSRDNARNNAITDLARQIERQLALYFSDKED